MVSNSNFQTVHCVHTCKLHLKLTHLRCIEENESETANDNLTIEDIIAWEIRQNSLVKDLKNISRGIILSGHLVSIIQSQAYSTVSLY